MTLLTVEFVAAVATPPATIIPVTKAAVTFSGVLFRFMV